MADDLTALTADSFRGRVRETFALVVDESMRLEAELVSVKESGTGAAGGRRPFSIVWRGPPEPVLPQRIYRFEHAEMGALEIFVVPIGTDEGGVLYEAVFS